MRIGHDTDTVAAIAGQVLGARWGASAIPWRWRRDLYGWPGHRDHATWCAAPSSTASGGTATSGWPSAHVDC